MIAEAIIVGVLVEREVAAVEIAQLGLRKAVQQHYGRLRRVPGPRGRRA
jgi:hypothetical protein